MVRISLCSDFTEVNILQLPYASASTFLCSFSFKNNFCPPETLRKIATQNKYIVKLIDKHLIITSFLFLNHQHYDKIFFFFFFVFPNNNGLCQLWHRQLISGNYFAGFLTWFIYLFIYSFNLSALPLATSCLPPTRPLKPELFPAEPLGRYRCL